MNKRAVLVAGLMVLAVCGSGMAADMAANFELGMADFAPMVTARGGGTGANPAAAVQAAEGALNMDKNAVSMGNPEKYTWVQIAVAIAGGGTEGQTITSNGVDYLVVKLANGTYAAAAALRGTLNP